MLSVRFQTRWDRTVFYGSVVGCIIILFITFYKYSHYERLANENEKLRKENTLLKEQIISLEEK